LTLWLLIGAAIFIVADYAVDRHIGSGSAESGALAIVLGAIVDGFPESMIFGISLASGAGVSASFLGAVMVSNVAEALAPSAELAAVGWSRAKLTLLWGTIVVACGLVSALGFAAGAHGSTGNRMAALAAGGVLSMLTNPLMPFSFERGGTAGGAMDRGWVRIGCRAALSPNAGNVPAHSIGRIR
jgi:ZIP family zinc transporter